MSSISRESPGYVPGFFLEGHTIVPEVLSVPT